MFWKKTATKSREYSESIINTVREPLLVLDQDLRVVTANHSFYGVFRVKPEETMGQLIYDLGNKQWDIPKLRELLETILPQKTTFENYEVEHNFTAIGRRIMLLNARQIHRAMGKERIILLAIEDITERKEIENGLEKAHEELKKLATELNRAILAKSEFLANMSHELRTPLNSIIGFTEVLQDQLFGPLNDQQTGYMGYIENSSKHLLILINDILDLSKVEAGKMELELSLVSVRELLNASRLIVWEKSMKDGITLNTVLEHKADISICGDERKLKQILYNLASNAVKFTPAGGTVTFKAALCSVPGEIGKNSEFIQISVQDTGIGIPPDQMHLLFKAFQQLESAYEKKHEGTGLGLALTKRMVELHEGTISAVSEAGKGSTFSVLLPINICTKATNTLDMEQSGQVVVSNRGRE